MALDDLTEVDRKVYEYIKAGDFEKQPWSTPAAATELDLEQGQVYESLHNLAKHIRDNVWIHYKDGGLRVSAE